MIKKLLLIIVLLLAAFLIVAAFQPNELRVTRSATINAPATTVFEQINDFHKWEAWSPWAKRDPQMKAIHEGPVAGPGASYAWQGNHEVGEGKMTILDSRPGEMVKIKLEFFKPFAGTNTAEFTLKDEGSSTHVSWTMYGPKKYLSKVMGLIMNMDKMIGGDFEKGLADIKRISESTPPAPNAPTPAPQS